PRGRIRRVEEHWIWFAGALLAVNLWAFAQVGWDKRASIRGDRRVPEARLIAPVYLGGLLGIWLGMRTFRHKTIKRSFQLKLLGATLLWALAVGGAIYLALRG
ncbi:MAG: DUF1294 domain-containing protein, partial [Planctomycetota bacterium]